MMRIAEADAFDRIIKLLKESDEDSSNIALRRSAISSTEQLWLLLLEDISKNENILPKELKTKIASIGIWIIKECMYLMTEKNKSLEQLININEIVRAGLD